MSLIGLTAVSLASQRAEADESWDLPLDNAWATQSVSGPDLLLDLSGRGALAAPLYEPNDADARNGIIRAGSSAVAWSSLFFGTASAITVQEGLVIPFSVPVTGPYNITVDSDVAGAAFSTNAYAGFLSNEKDGEYFAYLTAEVFGSSRVGAGGEKLGGKPLKSIGQSLLSNTIKASVDICKEVFPGARAAEIASQLKTMWAAARALESIYPIQEWPPPDDHRVTVSADLEAGVQYNLAIRVTSFVAAGAVGSVGYAYHATHLDLMVGLNRVTITPAATPPPCQVTIGSFDSPEPVVADHTLMLEAREVSSSCGSVARVEFYRDTNGDQELDPSQDALLGTDTSLVQGTAQCGFLATVAPGYHCFLVRAQDTHGNWSEPAVTTALVYKPPKAVNHFSIHTSQWDDPDSDDKDGVAEAGELVQLRIKLCSDVSLNSVYGILTTSDPDVIVTGDHAYWEGLVPGGQCVWPVGFYEARLAFSGHHSSECQLHLTYVVGDQTFYQDLSFSSDFPADGEVSAAFRLADYTIDDSASVSPLNNGDGIVQSGEHIRLQPRLCNSGQAPASGVLAWLTTGAPGVRLFREKSYPDLMPSACALPDGMYKYYPIDLSTSCAGAVDLEGHVTWDQGDTEFVMPNAITLNVLPAPWLSVSEEQWDFGVAEPGTPVTHTVAVSNIGTATLNVTGVTVLDQDGSPVADTTVTPNTFSIAAGQPQQVTIFIDTSLLNGKTITRQVVMISNGRLLQPGVTDRVVITGLVSESIRTYHVPGTASGCKAPDVGNGLVVWQTSANDIFGYRISSGQEYPICTAPGSQYQPKTDGLWVAWNDDRNSGGAAPAPSDVYAYSIPSGQEIAVAVSIADEDLVGVDNGYIAFTRADYVFPEQHDNTGEVRNLYLFNAATQNAQPLTSHNRSGYDPVWTVDQCDFGGGVLAWTERQWVWSGSSWSLTGGAYRTRRFWLGHDSTPLLLVDGHAGPPSCNNGAIAWRAPLSRTKTVRLDCVEDTWFFALRPNYAATTNWETHGNENQLKVDFYDDEVYASLLRFDFAGWPQDVDQVLAAKLHIYKLYGPDSCPDIEMQNVSSPWTEQEVSSKTHPSCTNDARSRDQWIEGGQGASWVIRDLPDVSWVTNSTFRLYGLCLRPWDYWLARTDNMNDNFAFVSREGDPNLRPFVEVLYSTDALDQWMLHELGGGTRQLTDDALGHSDALLGAGFLVYEKDSDSTRLYYWQYADGHPYPDGEGVIVQVPGAADIRDVRVDGNTAVWRSEGQIYYALLNQADIAVSSADTDLVFSNDQPTEGEHIDVTVTVKNLSGASCSQPITVELYDGDPGQGGQQIGADQVIAGGLGAHLTSQVVFSNVPMPNITSTMGEEDREFYVRITRADYDDPSNNTAHRGLTIHDDDVEGPAIEGIVVGEHDGDGEGRIGSDESVLVTWTASDPTGICNCGVRIDDGTAIPSATCDSMIIGPLEAGPHIVTIVASDCDNTPATSEFSRSLTVMRSETVEIVYKTQTITNGDTALNIGSFRLGSLGASAVFSIRNSGEQALSLGALTVSGLNVASAPDKTTLGPGQSTLFSLAVDTSMLGTFAGEVFLDNSDTQFHFAFHGRVKELPTITRVDHLGPVYVGAAFDIPYDLLNNASDQQPADGSPVGFLIEATNEGTLTKNGNTVVPGVTTLLPGEKLIWSGSAAGQSTAFFVQAWDDGLPSVSSVPVIIEVVESPQTGALKVIISPSQAVSAGAQWRVDGGAWQDSAATVSALSVGTHTVSFKDVAGWTKPADQTVNIVANQTATPIGPYIEIPSQTGSLKVTISPSQAVSAGAQWRVDGGAWQNSDATVSGLSVGAHTVFFKDIAGWTKPADQTVNIVANQTATPTGTYTEIPSQTGSLKVTISPSQAVSAGIQWRVDGGAWQNSGATVSGLSVGAHTVSFKDVAGWTKPADQTVSIVANQTATLTGAYAEVLFTLRVETDRPVPGGSPAPSVHASGTSAEVWAPAPPDGYHFDHWSGDVSGSDNPVMVLMDRNKTITANYAAVIVEPPPCLLPFCGCGIAETMMVSLFGLTLMRAQRRRLS